MFFEIKWIALPAHNSGYDVMDVLYKIQSQL